MTYTPHVVNGFRLGTIVTGPRFKLPRRRSKRIAMLNRYLPVVSWFLLAVFVFGITH